MDLIQEQQIALVAVENYVRKARNILFTISLICGFLFFIVYGMFFNWQGMRPSASAKYFIERISILATISNNQKRLTVFEQGLVDIALKCTDNIYCYKDSTCKNEKIEEDIKNGIIERDSLRNTLNNIFEEIPVWQKEEIQERFVDEVHLFKNRYLKMLGKKLEKYPSLLMSVTLYNWNTLSDTISKSINEILSRHNVNKKTKAEYTEPRKYRMPVIGIVKQLEDISVPSAVIMIFLCVWLRSSERKFIESIDICESFFRGKGERFRMTKLVVNSFIFMTYKSSRKYDSLKFNYKIIPLLLAPYVIFSSRVLANIHEFFIDYRVHVTWGDLNSAITRFLIVETILILFCAIFLAYIAWKILIDFYQLYNKLRDNLFLSSNKNGLLKIKNAFYWIIILPLLILGSFIVLQLITWTYNTDYFLGWLGSVIFVVVVIVGIYGLRITLSSDSDSMYS